MLTRRRISTFLIGSGVLALVCSLLLLISTAVVRAQDQPPPRPTITPSPTTIPTPAPTSPPDDPEEPTEPGRITGTVIDLTTGAPAPGIAVTVGDATVTSDANGNYDRSGLPAGVYRVALALAQGQGTPAQGPIDIELAAGATVIQHLSFRSQPPAATPAHVTPVPAPTPRPPPAPELPVTSGSADDTWLGLSLGLALLAAGIRIRRSSAQQSKT
jgi:hypothetical protein